MFTSNPQCQAHSLEHSRGCVYRPPARSISSSHPSFEASFPKREFFWTHKYCVLFASQRSKIHQRVLGFCCHILFLFFPHFFIFSDKWPHKSCSVSISAFLSFQCSFFRISSVQLVIVIKKRQNYFLKALDFFSLNLAFHISYFHS